MDETIFLDVIYCDALVFYAWKNITSWGAYLHELEFNIFENTDIPLEEAGRKKSWTDGNVYRRRVKFP